MTLLLVTMVLTDRELLQNMLTSVDLFSIILHFV